MQLHVAFRFYHYSCKQLSDSSHHLLRSIVVSNDLPSNSLPHYRSGIYCTVVKNLKTRYYLTLLYGL